MLIDHLRGHPGAVACLRDAVERGDELWSVSVVRAELFAGARADALDGVLLTQNVRHFPMMPELVPAYA